MWAAFVLRTEKRRSDFQSVVSRRSDPFDL